MKDIEKNLVIYGSLQTEAHKLDNIRCEIHLNLTDTSQLSADVYDLEGTIGFRYAAEFTGKMIRFDSISDNEEIHFEGGRSSGQIGGGSDKIGRIQIDRYEETTHINRNPIQSISFTYYLTPIEYSSEKACALRTTLEACCLDMIGSKAILNNGRTSLLRSQQQLETLFSIPGLFFQKKTTMLLPSKSMKVLIQVKADNINVHETRSQVEAKLCEYLQMLSFIESRFTNWFVCEIDARGASGKGFVADIYERIPQWRYPWDQHLQMHAVEYHKVLPLLVERYSSLDGNRKPPLTRPQTIARCDETQSACRYRTCLLAFKSGGVDKDTCQRKMKEYKYWGFSKRLLQVCDDAKIEWMDLYPEIKKEEVLLEQSPQKLEITNIRNAMIHDGDYPAMDKYDAVFLEIRVQLRWQREW